MEKPYWVLAYYKFVDLENPKFEVTRHKEFFEGRDVAGRIYISEQGINGQMSAAEEDAKAYIDWIHQDPRFADMQVKVHKHPEQAFARMIVKYREQLVAMDSEADMSLAGEHLSPADWKAKLESDEDYILIDVRNQYESAIGHFKGAIAPALETFREFPEYARQLKEKVDPKTPVMMYCTGGIRCELYSALMRKEGWDTVYQLDGGVINYGLKEGSKHWDGKLFVFDDRMAVPIADGEAEPIASCHHCSVKEDQYYNCANPDCNELFICCPSCLEEKEGCCSEACMNAPRRRPAKFREGCKPFRRLHTYR